MRKKKKSSKVINEGSHSEFLSEYVLNCKNISLIKSITVMYFDSFRFSKKLDVNIVASKKKFSQINDIRNNIISVEGYFD